MEFVGKHTIRVSAVPVGFLGAARGYVEDEGGDVIAVGFGDSLESADFFTLSVCDALELRASLDRAIASQRPEALR